MTADSSTPSTTQLLAQSAGDAYRQARNNARLYATATRAAEADPKKANAEASAHDRTTRDAHKAALLAAATAESATKAAEASPETHTPARQLLLGAIDLVVDAAAKATDALAWSEPRNRPADALAADDASRLYELVAQMLAAL